MFVLKGFKESNDSGSLDCGTGAEAEAAQGEDFKEGEQGNIRVKDAESTKWIRRRTKKRIVITLPCVLDNDDR